MYMVSLLSILPFTAPACGSAQGGGEAPEAPKVYFVRDITPENMVRLYEALERPATGKVHLIERMESRHGIHTLEHGEAIGLGSQQYELVELE